MWELTFNNIFVLKIIYNLLYVTTLITTKNGFYGIFIESHKEILFCSSYKA